MVMVRVRVKVMVSHPQIRTSVFSPQHLVGTPEDSKGRSSTA